MQVLDCFEVGMSNQLEGNWTSPRRKVLGINGTKQANFLMLKRQLESCEPSLDGCLLL